MNLVDVAAETLAIIERGEYAAPSGARVALRERIDRAVRGTVLSTPDELRSLVAAPRPQAAAGRRPTVEVTGETTAAAARRLNQAEGVERVVALNFASARRPGGGWLSGARAQEEDLARCSALYPCLVAQPRYYEANRAHPSPLYTDHAIYSPAVPFFRDDRLALLETPFETSIVTAPAPNAGEVLAREPAGAAARIQAALDTRAAGILAIAAAQGHRHLVLGAWGCGVFRNDPARVAGVFAAWLAADRFTGAFDRVVFAVYDQSRERTTLRAFARQFGG